MQCTPCQSFPRPCEGFLWGTEHASHPKTWIWIRIGGKGPAAIHISACKKAHCWICSLWISLGVACLCHAQCQQTSSCSLTPAVVLQAYGKKGIGEVPGDATLEFDVELLSVKTDAIGYRTKLVEG